MLDTYEAEISYTLRSKGIDTRKLVKEGRKNRKLLENVEEKSKSPRFNTKEIDKLCEQIVELLKKGYMLKEAKKELNIPEKTNVSVWLSYRNIDISRYTENRKKLRKEELLNKIKIAMQESSSLLEVSVKVGISYCCLTDTLRKHKEETTTFKSSIELDN